VTAPSKRLRELVYSRDNRRCVECGTDRDLTFGHREASGNGGRGRKAPPLTASDGITQCLTCNEAAESYGQEKALHSGHKIRRNRGGIPASQIPAYYRLEDAWFFLTPTGKRVRCTAGEAVTALAGAGSLLIKGTDS
jgi:hypothetical protein